MASRAFRSSRSCVFTFCTTLLATRAQRDPDADSMTSLGLAMFTRRQLCTHVRLSKRKRTSSNIPFWLAEDEVYAQVGAMQRYDVPAGVAEREPQVAKAHKLIFETSN